MDVFIYIFSWIYYLMLFFNRQQASQKKNETQQPHIIVIMTDDMGWNDVGFHGSNEIPTPNLDALAYSGVILNRHYSAPTCTPSRAAFFTGRHPVRTGLQGLPINAAEPRGLPLDEKILPQYLRELGYVTRLVGKWHLGYYTERHTPTRRGFDSFAGYYSGYIRYFQHSLTKAKHTGIDLHMDTIEHLGTHESDQYFTDFISDQAEAIIKSHNKERPLYLHIAHAAAHASENADPLEVRDLSEINRTLGYIPNLNRRKYAGMVAAMDESVGKIVKALGEADMLDKSVVIMMSDNGAATATDVFPNHGSNYPLRGLKATVFEGGVRVPTCIFSAMLRNRSLINSEYIHITDWLPTIYKLAGGDPRTMKELDGVDQWTTISQTMKSGRDSFLINIDEVLGPQAAVVGRYKLIRGVNSYYKYYGESGKDYSPAAYNITSVLTSLAGTEILKSLNYTFPEERKIDEIRKKASVSCERISNYSNCSRTCLFDIIEDPCETTDVSDKHLEMIKVISSYIESYKSVLKPQTNVLSDPAGFPDKHNGFWMPWLDQEYTPPEDRNISAIWSVSNYCEGYPIDDPRNCL